MMEADARRILTQAREHHQQQDYAKAEVGYRSVLRHFPRSSNAHFLLARNLEAQGQIKAAIEAYERAIELDPKPTIALLSRGALLVRANHARRAIEVLQRLI
jgi:Tfp pilus assembly protein PilF